MNPVSRRLRDDLPFRRIALVLSGGGALGAYEVGVFRTLEAAGLRPQILLGVSVGAINAVVWLAHGFRSEGLVRAWSRLRPSSLGIRWPTVVMRVLGALAVLLGLLQLVSTLADLPSLGVMTWARRHQQAMSLGLRSLVLDSIAWIAVGVLGAAMVALSRDADEALARLWHPAEPARIQRATGWALALGTALYLVLLPLDVPWPRSFHLTLLVLGGAVWAANRPGRVSAALKHAFRRLMPETGGPGVWRSGARRLLLQGLVAEGDASRLMGGDTHLVLSACEVESGRMHYFINWSDPSPEFCTRVRDALGEPLVVTQPAGLLEAAVASSAIPVVFEPVRILGRDYMDGGVFTNQPLSVALADGADAIVMVLVSPSASPPRPSPHPNLLEMATRLPQLASWRDLQAQLRVLPEGWAREGDPGRVCVVEPERPLPGSVLGFDPGNAAELMGLGEADAWRALERSGWLAAGPPASAAGRDRVAAPASASIASHGV